MTAPLGQEPQDNLNFLMKLLKQADQSKMNKHHIQSFLLIHHKHLNESLLESFPEAVKTIFERNVFEQQFLALAFCMFGGLIQNFSLGNEAINLELSIAAYKTVIEILGCTYLPEYWTEFLGITYNVLGSAYLQRTRGDRAYNLEQAIQYFYEALKIHSRQKSPQIWASIQNNLGATYIERIRGNRTENLERAITCFQLILSDKVYQESDVDWAEAQGNLGVSYFHRIQGNRAENLEQAINCYQLALKIFSAQKLPKSWARTQNNLGGAYSYRILGNRADNLERAIECFHLALQVSTRRKSPYSWASIQSNLADTYSDRIYGNRADNLEKAIDACQAALQVYSQQNAPYDWAGVHNNLAKAYSKRIYGNRADNLEKAIDACQAALQVYSQQNAPYDWARVQLNLGNAYSDRIYGDQADNIEKAINAHQSALQVRTRQDFPYDWAQAQNNLGSAYLDRIYGNRADNIEKAINAYQSALQVRTRQDFPEEWAQTQTNLASAARQRIQGNYEENLEQAIQGYQLVLQVYTLCDFPKDWARAQNNLGNAYLDRIYGYQADNIEKAINAYQSALQVRTRQDFPEEWAVTQHNLGQVYVRRDRSGDLELAIGAYKLALEVRTPNAFPLNCFNTGRALGNAAFIKRRWQDAITGYTAAINAIENLRNWAANEDRRKEIQEQASEVYEKMVQACVNTRQFAKAIEVAERSRSKRVVELIASNDLYHSGNIPPEIETYLKQYEAVQEEINKLRFGGSNNDENRTLASATTGTRGRAALDAATEKIQALEAEKRAIRQQLSRLDPVSAGLLQVSAPNLAAMQCLVDSPTTILLNFYTTSTDTHIFVLRQEELTCHTCSGQSVETLQQWLINQWLRPYLEINQADDPEERNERRKKWAEQMPEVLQELAQRLQLNSLIETYLQGATELILVPHLFLHQIPFAALPTQEGFLGDRFQLRIVPSCQVLEFCQQRPPVAFDSIQHGTVEDATEDLPCSSFEGEAIAKLYNIPATQRLRGRDQAKVENYRQLVQQAQVILSSHHAQSRLDNPLESMLVLADGAITLGQLLTPAWRLPHLSDVFLSCCETGLGASFSLTDEPLSLATGFLCAGARSVVSTLWAVDDLATALFSIHYHQHRRSLSRPEAVQRAQQDLRQMTGADLAQHYKQPLLTLLDQKYEAAEAKRQQAAAQMSQYNPQSDDYQHWKRDHDLWARAATQIEDTQTRLKKLCRTQLPFAHAIYWAAFVTQGLR